MPDTTELQHSTSIDISTETEFDTWVRQESHTRPVVVDFWAPWCGPCRALGPALEALAKQGEGRWLLAKVNVDQVQSVAREYSIQSIPAVKAIRNGAVIEEFVGALPPKQIEEWLSTFVEGPADELHQQGRRAEQEERLEEARSLYQQALSHKKQHIPSMLGLTRIDLAEDKREDGLKRLNTLYSPGKQWEQEIAQLKMKLSLDAPVDSNIEQLQERITSNPEDLQLRLELGQLYTSMEQYEHALETYLDIIRLRKEEEGEQAKQRMVQIFGVLGMQSSVTQTFRSALSVELFS